MASGYAKARPAVHPRVLDLARAHLGLAAKATTALDLGCGSGISTAALSALADRVVGVEPVTAMLLFAGDVAPGAAFVAGCAEALPFSSAAFQLVTAAGSLNFADDLNAALSETRRVLAPGGTLIIYDFRQGSDFRDSSSLTEWHSEFKTRYPPPPPARPFDPVQLPYAANGLHLASYEPFEIGLTLTPEFYVNYAMTETNVARAVAAGESESSIRAWCAETVQRAFERRPREVLFHGYFACARPIDKIG